MLETYSVLYATVTLPKTTVAQKFTSSDRPKVAWSTGVNLLMMTRRSVDDIFSRTIGRQALDIDLIRPTVGQSYTLVCVVLLTMHVFTLFMKLKYAFWPCVQILSVFLVGFSCELFVWRFAILNIKRLQLDTEHFLKLVYERYQSWII